MVGDGQVSFGPTILKPNAKKVRVLMDGKVLTHGAYDIEQDGVIAL